VQAWLVAAGEVVGEIQPIIPSHSKDTEGGFQTCHRHDPHACISDKRKNWSYNLKELSFAIAPMSSKIFFGQPIGKESVRTLNF